MRFAHNNGVADGQVDEKIKSDIRDVFVYIKYNCTKQRGGDDKSSSDFTVIFLLEASFWFLLVSLLNLYKV